MLTKPEDVYLDYPVHRSLSLDYGNGSTYHATLEEETLEEDEPTGDAGRVPTFHGYSGSGSASAEYVYVGTHSSVNNVLDIRG
jgi:N-acetylated-alpha-linked acidic dipeptidase